LRLWRADRGSGRLDAAGLERERERVEDLFVRFDADVDARL